MSNKLAQMYQEIRELPATFRFLRRVLERNQELSRENEKLALDNLDMLEDYSNAMDKLHELEMEVERLQAKNRSLQEQPNGSMDLRYQHGVNAGEDKVISAVRKVLAMTTKELSQASNPGCKGGNFTVQVEPVDDNGNPSDHAGQWEVHDRICQYGGCAMPSYYPDELRARLYTAIRNTARIPVIRDMCDQCRKDYYESII